MKKRFIAGAVCPKCKEMDRLVLEISEANDKEEVQRRRCVSCGFSEDYTPSENRYDSLPKGKREKTVPTSSTSDVVRIIDPVLLKK
tara:strand:+ start:115 stop:372 length:258 start_codon:yes stop_codon:yes gene_type:complete